jgi:tRNA 2-thiouridine synthesizing protein A
MTHSDVPAVSMPAALDNIPADLVVDARGLRCPLPLLRAKQALRNLTTGALLQVITTDGASVRDFQAYARISGHKLEGFLDDTGKEFTFWLRKSDAV